MKTAWFAVAAVLFCLPAGAKEPFGPWDAGAKREVKRQKTKGLDRAKHPVVGDSAKVPGEGPPPPPLRADPDVPETVLRNVNEYRGSMSSNPMFLAALVYSNFLTKVDGSKCQHLPTCSRFAAQAVGRFGPIGILMGLDRVIQPPESSAVRTLPQVEGWGQVRHLDPVDNYVFWTEDANFTGFPVEVPEQPLVFEDDATGETVKDAAPGDAASQKP